MKQSHLAICLLLALVSQDVGAQQTPTEKLNEQRRQQAQAAEAAKAQGRRVTTRRLPAPCVVPDSYYPFRTW